MKRRGFIIAFFGAALASSIGLTWQFAGEAQLQRSDVPSLVGRYRDGRGRFGREGPSTGNAQAALCDAITSGDKSGAWDCLRGDGTMASGSATTWVATGSPTNSTENGWPVRTYTAAQNDQQPANAAFPQTDFSVCVHHRSVAVTVSDLVNFSNDGTNAGSAALPFESAANGSIMSFISDGAGSTPSVTAAAGTKQAGVWQLMCFTYGRTGGAGNNLGDLYVNGVSVGTSSTMRLAQALSSRWSSNGYVGASGGSATSIRGLFVTYKRLSAADVARIYGALAP